VIGRCHGDTWVVSIESAAAQVVGDYDVSDGVKYKLNVVGICSTRLMAVDLFQRAPILRLKL